MSAMIARLDSKGRLVVPKSKRERDAMRDGDVFVVDPNSAEGTITFIRVESQLQRHLAESKADYDAGRYQTIEQLAAELGVDLEDV